MNNIILSSIEIDALARKIAVEVISSISPALGSKTATVKEEYITRKETAKRCKISLPTLNEYTKLGIIPAYRFGSRVLYKAAEVDASLKQIVSSKFKPSSIKK